MCRTACRQSTEDDGDKRSIRDILRLLLMKLDTDADVTDDVTRAAAPRGYINVSHSQPAHDDSNKNTRVVNRVSLPTTMLILS